MKVLNQDMPFFVKKELENIFEILAPIMRKVMTYRFISLPLIVISLMNLFFVVSTISINRETAPVIIIYALLGAVGMALAKEAKHKQKEFQHQSVRYITERIKNSPLDSEQLKLNYIEMVNKNPIQAINYFVEFLQKENKIKYND
ncbi:DUF5392 family protein [Metabacillus malikii]|uniref:C-di-AMP phosphodiesterase-like protein n=1 Tax=Metabacillus malikii TaxID=1504265 RepID=A0ABT9Z9Q9_9BACI|nr:DUF5392 family protein [Metabacillus malikii]MDQ0228977.1 c-di-AMP phosphodiesterase-like protein [Metabacillus malikii]